MLFLFVNPPPVASHCTEMESELLIGAREALVIESSCCSSHMTIGLFVLLTGCGLLVARLVPVEAFVPAVPWSGVPSS